MRRVVLALAAVLALAGCGGGSSQQSAEGSHHPAGWGGTPKGVALPAPEKFSAVPTRTMYDAVSVSEIPSRPFAAAGYTAGRWPTWNRVRSLASHAVSIAISASFHADCLDDEPGDATPAQAGPWAVADIHAGFAKPCVYGDLSNMPGIKASLAASLGSNWRARVFLWLAWYRRIPGLVTGYNAVQYDDTCLGRNLDCSTVSLAFLSIAQPPYVAPKPKPAPKPAPKPPVCDKRCHQQKALAATRRALTGVENGLKAHGCRRPYRRAVCVSLGHLESVLTQRERYFARQLARK